MNAAETLAKAIGRNDRLRLPDLLRRRRIVAIDRGPMSHEGAPELLALLAIRQGYWYGHVLKVAPEEIAPEARHRGPWVSIIVQAFTDVDDRTPEEIFRNFHHALVERLDYQPAHALGPDDLFRMSPTFEEACLALADMAADFDPLLAIGANDDPYDDREEHPLARRTRLDMRCFDIYGLCPESCEEDEDNPWAPGGVFYEAAVAAERWAERNAPVAPLRAVAGDEFLGRDDVAPRRIDGMPRHAGKYVTGRPGSKAAGWIGGP